MNMEKFFDFCERHFFKIVVGCVLALFLSLAIIACNVAKAADVRVSWTQPTQNTDGSAIPATGAGSIASNRVEWGSCVGTAFGTAAGSQSIPAATSYTVTGLAPAMHCFRVTAINTYGSESGVSNVAQRNVAAPVPNPPVVTTATVVRAWTGGGLSVVAGRIDLGEPCGKKMKNVWHTVSRSDVKLNAVGKRFNKKVTLVAKCGMA